MASTSRTAQRKGTRRAESPESTVVAEESGTHGSSSRAHRTESRESKANSPMFDAMLEQFTLSTHKECAQAFVDACHTMLRNAHAIREAQIETNLRAQGMHEQAGAHQLRLSCGAHAVEGKHVLGEIDADEENGHGLPLPSELMREPHFPSWHFVADHRLARSAWDGEVPFIL
jgi:hypothetical protein